ncbi:MFS transporter [Scopulibacillus cellulosilyticus]|uniref:MFS transporter n=1 Tax=Scopulibacillus cellulosilyticus TaxID=2665665 RepID=A0ABW2Q2W9_9BACL
MLIFGNFFTFMGFQMLIPIMPPHIQDIGASGVEIGLVTTLFSLGAVFMRPFIGFLLEFRTRKPLVLIGILSLFVITIFYPLTQIVFVFLLIRLFHGLAWGWATTSNGTAAVDNVPPKRLGEGMGYYGLSATIGMVIAPSLGIFLYNHYNFRVTNTVSVILCAIAIILLSISKYRSPDNVKNVKREELKFSFFGSLIDKTSWYQALVTLMATFGYGTVTTFIVIFATARGIHQIYLFYLFNAIVATFSRPLTGRLFDRKGPKTIILICAFLAFAALWVLSFATSNIFIIISGILFGAGYGSLLPTLQAWILSQTKPERRGVANGMYYSAIDLGIGLSGLVFGVVSQFVGISTIFKISSFFFILVMILTIFYRKRHVGKSIKVQRSRRTGA